MPGVVAGFLFAFVGSFGNIAVTVFLTELNVTTSQVELLAYLKHSFD